jgi:hypothetical protein
MTVQDDFSPAPGTTSGRVHLDSAGWRWSGPRTDSNSVVGMRNHDVEVLQQRPALMHLELVLFILSRFPIAPHLGHPVSSALTTFARREKTAMGLLDGAGRFLVDHSAGS